MSFSCIPIITSSSDHTLLGEAASKGIFYLAIPPNFMKHIDDAIVFCYEFFTNARIKACSSGKYGGYYEHEAGQIESFHVEKKDWGKILSPSLRLIANDMNLLTLSILENILKISGVPRRMWEQGTGNVVNGGGQHHFSFNHYRTQRSICNAHYVSGFMSIIFIEQTKLEARVDNEWLEIEPLDGYFIVVLGKALETLINNTDIVVAPLHRVRQRWTEGTGFGISCDGDSSAPVMQYVQIYDQLGIVHSSYDSYLESCFNGTY